MAVQTSNIISSQVRPHSLRTGNTSVDGFTQIYRTDDKPLYRRGNRVLLGLAAYNAALFVGAKAYYVWKNKYDTVLQQQCFEGMTD